MSPLVIVIGTALLASVIAYAQWQREKRRGIALAGLAGALGWTYRGDNDPNLHAQYAHALFDEGRHRIGYHLLRGNTDIAKRSYPVTMGDYRFTTGSGKSEQTHRMSLMLIAPPYCPLPALRVVREGLGGRILDALGFDHVDFESDDFNRKYRVTTTDKRFASAVISARMIDFLLSTTPPHVELKNGVCLFYDGTGTEWAPETFRAHLAWARQFFELWPVDLLAELKCLARPPAETQ